MRGGPLLPVAPPPVDPDQARELIHEELSKREYDQGDGFIPWLLGLLDDWVQQLLHGVTGGSTGQLIVLICACVLLVVAAVLVMRRAGMLRRRSAVTVGTSVTADPDLPASTLRELAAQAHTDGRRDDAVVLALRALVRDLEERTLLDSPVGLTAHEAARRAAAPFPDLLGRLQRLADAFDTAAYSHRSVTAKQSDDALRLVDYIAQARPQLTDTPAEAIT